MCRQRSGLTPVPAGSSTLWTAEKGSDRTSWVMELTVEEQAAIVEFSQSPEVGDLHAVLGDAAARWLDVLTNGPGFVLVRDFPVSELSPIQAESAYRALGNLVGTLVGQDRSGSLVTHIRDERLPDGPGIRRYQTNQSQDFHSDASDVVMLMCLRPAKVGGLSRVISAHAVYNEILRRDPELTALLLQPFPWSRHTERRPGENPYFQLAPIAFVNGTPRISIIPWFIRQSQAHPTAPRLTDDQLAALTLMESTMASTNLQIAMDFRPGDIQFLNNTTVLHARDAYEDHPDPALRRHLIRLWLKLDAPVAEDVLSGQAP